LGRKGLDLNNSRLYKGWWFLNVSPNPADLAVLAIVSQNMGIVTSWDDPKFL